MKTVRKLESTIPTIKPRKRVAAYARISMETERLLHSLSAQVSHYSSLIQSNPEWEYAGVYADEGISGTQTDKRKEFMRMLADCDAGRIDIILTKSISRFARNTVDLLQTVRHLRDIGVEVRFEREYINSMSGDGELMLTILASFAQEESRSISDNVKWATRKRFEQGIPNGQFRVYGYRWENDHLVIVPEEAAIVRRIFLNFLDGKSRLETEREFAAAGITTRAGCRWTDSNIRSVLTNITYTGNMLLQKEYISDPITKKRKKNHGELAQYFVADTHEAIIDMETFEFVQSEIARRKELGPFANKSLNTTCFTGKIKCEKCGQSFMHNPRKNHAKCSDRGEKPVYWTCGSRKRKGTTCTARDIPDTILLRECCAALGIEAFDEEIFSKQIDHISVPENGVLLFHFYNGNVVERHWINTSKRDWWTPERRAAVSEKRRQISQVRQGSTCFTGKIKCGCCGNNFQRQAKKGRDGESISRWICGTHKRKAVECTMPSVREDVLQEKIAEACGLTTFSEDSFMAMVDHVTMTGKGTLTVYMRDGSTSDATFSTKKRMPPASDETRRKRSESMKARCTPEYRAHMSESMKQIRKERGSAWRKG